MKKTNLDNWLTLSLLTCAMLTACGGGSGGASGPTDAPAGVETPAPAPEPITGAPAPAPTDPSPAPTPDPAAPAPAPAEPAPAPTAPAPAPADPAPAPVPADPDAPVAALQATRLSGPAPLAVMFDATASTPPVGGSRPFHTLNYAFNFGDDRGETWSVSGAPKNVQQGGPLAAHVFERPGTYSVRVRVQAASGTASEATVNITVQDPNTYYAGTRTVCVSTSANYAGCPTGAAQQTSLPSELDGRRVLLRRGESFPTIDVKHRDDGVTVGAFGSTGPKPRVANVLIGFGRPMTADFPDEITVMDLDVAGGIAQHGTASRILLLRNDLDDAGATVNNSIVIGGGAGYWALSDPNRVVPSSAFYHPREIFVVENRVVGSTERDDVPLGNLFGYGSRVALLGNDMSRAFEHTVRLFNAHKTVIAHNALRGGSSDGARHALKLHSGGFGAYNDNFATSRESWAASEIVVANNLFGDAADNNTWTVAIRPQNSGPDSDEGIENVIIESNTFVRGVSTNTDLLTVGRYITTRGNARRDGGALNISVDLVSSYPLLPLSWRGPYFTQ